MVVPRLTNQGQRTDVNKPRSIESTSSEADVRAPSLAIRVTPRERAMGSPTQPFQALRAQGVSYHLYVILQSGIYRERCVETSEVLSCPARRESSA